MADARTRRAFVGAGASGLRGAHVATDVPLPVITITPGAFDARFDGDLFLLGDEAGTLKGWVAPPQGGEAFADVVTEKLGGDHIQHKHIANVKYNDFTLSAPVGTTKGLYEWIKASFDKSYARKNGTVVAADFNFKAVASANFFDALITEITVPALDASSKDPAYMVLKAAPTATAYQPPKDQSSSPPPKAPPANFKLQIDGLDTSRVSKIESFTVKQSVSTDSTGNPRVDLEIPDLSIWVDADPKATWPAWEDDFLIRGNNDQAHERSGSLSFLDQKSAELLRLTFSNLGVFKGTPSATADGYPVKWELYCEDMGLAFGDAPWS